VPTCASSEMETWPDSGHFVHIEFPERAAERVLDFLDRHR
jgi:pimeloyl-ACP methyl ester carboxylesterase